MCSPSSVFWRPARSEKLRHHLYGAFERYFFVNAKSMFKRSIFKVKDVTTHDGKKMVFKNHHLITHIPSDYPNKSSTNNRTKSRSSTTGPCAHDQINPREKSESDTTLTLPTSLLRFSSTLSIIDIIISVIRTRFCPRAKWLKFPVSGRGDFVRGALFFLLCLV